MYYSQCQAIASLQLALKAAEYNQSPQSDGTAGGLSADQFTAVLTQCFALKQGESIGRLVQAAAAELNVTTTDAADLLLYDNLFTEVSILHCVSTNISDIIDIVT